MSKPFENVSPGRRRNMQANKGKDTRPELTLRRLLHGCGYRFRLHRKDLPGRPDIAFPSRTKAIEVRGCFWHGHGCHPLGQLPRTRREYWEPKILGNRSRDLRNMQELRNAGWEVIEVWECDIRADPQAILARLISFLGPRRS
ncbi:very short patch repair endonuclease [Bradyrhizobium sp. BEA-2-5]|uniref:very short patch repair endonuclease n=1 Tax=Bradyrhizobium sp. BEA-2-5 TaxID=3080015 RepID=UPI00293E6D0C|nr:very short patch repair endonuclease [Bradyrhizobium sp. BEA-2-5]WOH82121.1 very short patch repair endonuclease [Bradyrhizobium sp. BEA-2-5]